MHTYVNTFMHWLESSGCESAKATTPNKVPRLSSLSRLLLVQQMAFAFVASLLSCLLHSCPSSLLLVQQIGHRVHKRVARRRPGEYCVYECASNSLFQSVSCPAARSLDLIYSMESTVCCSMRACWRVPPLSFRPLFTLCVALARTPSLCPSAYVLSSYSIRTVRLCPGPTSCAEAARTSRISGHRP